ncbi:hypothetical protein MIFL109517_06890 [Micrococcus flavus]
MHGLGQHLVALTGEQGAARAVLGEGDGEQVAVVAGYRGVVLHQHPHQARGVLDRAQDVRPCAAHLLHLARCGGSGGRRRGGCGLGCGPGRLGGRARGVPRRRGRPGVLCRWRGAGRSLGTSRSLRACRGLRTCRCLRGGRGVPVGLSSGSRAGGLLRPPLRGRLRSRVRRRSRGLRAPRGGAGERGPAQRLRPVRRAPGGGRAGGGTAVVVGEGGAGADTTLEGLQAGGQAAVRIIRGGQHEARHEQLEVQPGARGAHHVRQGQVGDVREAGELGPGELGGLRGEPADLVLGHAVQDGAGLVRQGAGDHQVAEPVQQVLHEPARVLAGLHHAVRHAEHGGGVVRGDGVDHVVQQRLRGEPEQADGELVRDLPLLGAADQLVQHGQGVPHRAGARAHHERQDPGLHPHALLLAQLLQVGDQRLRGHQAERVVVGARADGADHLVRLRGSEDELEVLRRLLHDLQQRVEAGRRDHVGLVDDEDLEAVPHRGERGPLAQPARVVHAAVAGGVDLQDVQGAGAARGEVPARVALPAGRGRGALRAVQAARQDPGGRGLATAARAGEEVGVVHAVLGQRGPERHGDMVLSDHVLEPVGAVAAVQGGAHPRQPIRWVRTR